jgi:HD-GYP domain-containing protein (c-di-GMP phosphodiesterase class II)
MTILPANPVVADTSDESLGSLWRCRAQLQERFGTEFGFYDAASGTNVLPDETAAQLRGDGGLYAAMRRACDSRRAEVERVNAGISVLLLPMPEARRGAIVAAALFRTRLDVSPEELAELLDVPALAPRVPFCEPDLLQRMGQLALAAIQQERLLEQREAEIEQIASQVAHNYEELTLLYRLTRDAQVPLGCRATQELAVSLLYDVISVRQLAFVGTRGDAILTYGQPDLDDPLLRGLVERFADAATERPLVRNCAAASPGLAELPVLEQFVIVPVKRGSDQFGWLVAINAVDGRALGSVEASLMTAVAAIIATHHVQVKLFRNVEDLFLGVVRALTSAIDAKDPYTRGHSDRVARIAQRLAAQLQLPAIELDQVYLSGLLHDVGKIGVDDAVLRKPDRLTREEFEHIKRHPHVGYEILAGVRHLRPVLPGVRHHHENFDGTGYPDRLRGDEIALMARIIAVADSYDAMRSDRPYRDPLPAGRIDGILRDGAGRQWDADVVRAFWGCQQEVEQSVYGPRHGDRTTAPARGPDTTPLRDVSQFVALGVLRQSDAE